MRGLKLEYSLPRENRKMLLGSRLVGSTRQRIEPTFIQLLFLSLSVRGLLPLRTSAIFAFVLRSRKPGNGVRDFRRQQ